jgi:glycosyltransferase involved in cell wall biosynthesis
MKIVHIITRSDSIGGAQIHVRDLSQALQKQGHEVIVLVGGDGPFLQELHRAGIPYRPLQHLVRPISPKRDLAAIREIARQLRDLRPDVVAAHSSKAGWIGRFVGRVLKIPTVFTAHGWAFTEGGSERKRWFYTIAERVAALFSTRIIAVSEYDYRLARSRGVADSRKLCLVHNGVPETEPAELAAPERTPPRIVMVARFEEPKDQLRLLTALAQIGTRDWTLDLIGDGPLRSSAEQRTRELGLQERVNFLGNCSDVAQRLPAYQVFVLLSKYEGFPLSILEAMRAGLPVIASRVGGIQEAVQDGVHGYLISGLDDAELVDRLNVLLQDPQLRVRMGSLARERYTKQFTIEKMVQKTLHVYTEA